MARSLLAGKAVAGIFNAADRGHREVGDGEPRPSAGGGRRAAGGGRRASHSR
jgi:hypothetical protein